ncbi:MAG: hypothetical protein AMJ43_02215 [Coxiella sp. DG_40]|nr:MAG: hypothetical protein AMJ43_02215 [Coxiella sp. DG_40]
MPSLVARSKYFRILIDYAVKLYISSAPLMNKSKNIVEIDKMLCTFEENEVVKWMQQLSKISEIAWNYDKKSTDELKNEFNEKVSSLYKSIENRFTQDIKTEMAKEFLAIAGSHFTVIRKLENCQSDEFANLENTLNQIVQKQFNNITNLWAKEKLQILCFIHTSIHELDNYEHLYTQPNFSGFLRDLIGYNHKKEDPLTSGHLNQLMSNLDELKAKVLSWPSLFELVRTFRDYYAYLTKAHSNLNNFMTQDNPLYCVSNKIFKNATELLSSWENSPLIKDECTARDVRELTKERLTQVMNDRDQIEALLQSAVAYHEKVKNPQLIDEQQAQAKTCVPLLPQTGSCVYTKEGSDVTLECLSSSDYEKFFVASDIHGELNTLQNSEVFSAERQLLPCLINGDFIDRGLYSLETTIFLFLLQQLFPNYFIILRGNHEEDFIQGIKREFKQQIQGGQMKIPLGEKNAFIPVLQNVINQSGTQIKKFEDLFKNLFALLPIAAVNHKFLIIHGGLTLQHEPCVSDFFDNTREFMLTAIYNPGRKTDGLLPTDDNYHEITGSIRPIFNDNTVWGIQKMGLMALLGHQHHRAKYPWGHVLNTNFGTNKSQLPCVLLCSYSHEPKIETYDIKRNVLFPEIAELQLYFRSLSKEARRKTFGTLLCEQFSSDEHTTNLIRAILLYLYACIPINDHTDKKNLEFFDKIAQHEVTACLTSIEQNEQLLMLQYGHVGADRHMREVLKQRGETTSDAFTNALNILSEQVQKARTKLEDIANRNDAEFLELISKCPLCLVNFIKDELEFLIDNCVGLAKIGSVANMLVKFFNTVARQRNGFFSSQNSLQDKMTTVRAEIDSHMPHLPEKLQRAILSHLSLFDVKKINNYESKVPHITDVSNKTMFENIVNEVISKYMRVISNSIKSIENIEQKDLLLLLQDCFESLNTLRAKSEQYDKLLKDLEFLLHYTLEICRIKELPENIINQFMAPLETFNKSMEDLRTYLDDSIFFTRGCPGNPL